MVRETDSGAVGKSNRRTREVVVEVMVVVEICKVTSSVVWWIGLPLSLLKITAVGVYLIEGNRVFWWEDFQSGGWGTIE